jgi:hypothetical protein
MATISNIAIGLLRPAGITRITRTTQTISRYPSVLDAIPHIGQPLSGFADPMQNPVAHPLSSPLTRPNTHQSPKNPG